MAAGVSGWQLEQPAHKKSQHTVYLAPYSGECSVHLVYRDDPYVSTKMLLGHAGELTIDGYDGGRT